MNRTTADSKAEEFDIVCMSFGKEPQKGIEVVEAGQKDSFLKETMEIKAGNCKLLKNGNLEMETGNIIVNFADYKQAKNNNESKITKLALEKAKREGKIIDLNKRRIQNDTEQVI